MKLGPAVNAMERRAAREAEAEGRDYEPVTDRGRVVQEAQVSIGMESCPPIGVEV